MTLFNKLEDIIILGYSVNFKAFMQHLYITVEKETVIGNIHSKCSSLPLPDHFKEDRIIQVIDWSVTEIDEEIKTENNGSK